MALSTREIIEAELLGRRISKRRAGILENQLRENQWNIEARITLLTYYRFKRPFYAVQQPPHDPYCLHVLWLIRNLPEEPASSCSIAQIDKFIYPEAYEVARGLWLAHLQNDPSKVNIYLNVFGFLRTFEPNFADEILNEALLAFPNHPRLLMHKIGRLCDSGKSMESVREAVALNKNYRTQIGSITPRMEIEIARLALMVGDLDEAAAHAREVLAWSDSGNVPSDLFAAAHTILGLVALKTCDVDKGEFHLLESRNYPKGIFVSINEDPELGLAMELVELGRLGTVEKYLWSCLKSARGKHMKVLFDILLLKLGRKPSL